MRLYLVTERSDAGMIAVTFRNRGHKVHVGQSRFSTTAVFAEEQRMRRVVESAQIQAEWMALRDSDVCVAITPGGTVELGVALGAGMRTAIIGSHTSRLTGLVSLHADSPEELCDLMRDYF